MDKEKHKENKNSLPHKSSKDVDKDTNTINKQNNEVDQVAGKQKSKD